MERHSTNIEMLMGRLTVQFPSCMMQFWNPAENVIYRGLVHGYDAPQGSNKGVKEINNRIRCHLNWLIECNPFLDKNDKPVILWRPVTNWRVVANPCYPHGDHMIRVDYKWYSFQPEQDRIKIFGLSDEMMHLYKLKGHVSSTLPDLGCEAVRTDPQVTSIHPIEEYLEEFLKHSRDQQKNGRFELSKLLQ